MQPLNNQLQRGFSNSYSAPVRMPWGMGLVVQNARFFIAADLSARTFGSGIKRGIRSIFAVTESQKKAIEEQKIKKKIKFKIAHGISYLLDSHNFPLLFNMLMQFEQKEKSHNPHFSLRKAFLKKPQTPDDLQDFLEMQYRLLKHVARHIIVKQPRLAGMLAEAIARMLTLDDRSNAADGFKMAGSFTTELTELLRAISELVITMENDPSIADFQYWESCTDFRPPSRESPTSPEQDLSTRSVQEQKDFLEMIVGRFFNGLRSLAGVFVSQENDNKIDYTQQALTPEIIALQSFQRKTFAQEHLLFLPKVVRFITTILRHDPRLSLNDNGEPDGSQSPELLSEMEKRNTAFKKGLYCLIKGNHINSIRPDTSLEWADILIDYLKAESDQPLDFTMTESEDTKNERDLARYSIISFILHQFFPDMREEYRQEFFERFANLIENLESLTQVLGGISQDLIHLLRLEENQHYTRTLVASILHQLYGYTPEQLLTDIRNSNTMKQDIKDLQPQTLVRIVYEPALSLRARDWSRRADHEGTHFIDDMLVLVLEDRGAFSDAMIFEILQAIAKGETLVLLEKLFCSHAANSRVMIPYSPDCLAVFDEAYNLDLINRLILQHPAGFLRFVVKILMQVFPPLDHDKNKTATEKIAYLAQQEEILYQHLFQTLYPEESCTIMHFEALITGCADLCYGINHHDLKKIQEGLEQLAPVLIILSKNLAQSEQVPYLFNDIASKIWPISVQLSRSKKRELSKIQPQERRKEQEKIALDAVRQGQENLRLEFLKRLSKNMVEVVSQHTADFAKLLHALEDNQHEFLSLPWLSEMLFSHKTSPAARKIISCVLDTCHSFKIDEQAIIIENMGFAGHALFIASDLRKALSLVTIFVALGNYALSKILDYATGTVQVDFTARALSTRQEQTMPHPEPALAPRQNVSREQTLLRPQSELEKNQPHFRK